MTNISLVSGGTTRAGDVALPPAVSGDDADPKFERDDSPNPVSHRVWPVHLITVVVVAIGVPLAVALAIATSTARDNNEKRLLHQRTREAAAVLIAALPSIQTPLASAVEVVEESDGADQQAFRRLLTPIVEVGQPYVSASLWDVTSGELQPLQVIGEPPKLASQPPDAIRTFLKRSVATTKLTVIGLLDGGNPRLGYSITSVGSSAKFVAYAEAALPADRTSVVPADSAFSGLHNAVYLGEAEDPSLLLTASTTDLPLRGRRATERVPFGDNTLLLVMTADGHLGGGLLNILPWLVIAFGLVTTLGSATLTEWLLRRRDEAQRLSEENAALYAGQRSVAETLQHSLLPARLADVSGLELASQYLPGVASLDIGGDWYDAIPLDDGRLMLVVGDVSGRGLGAGTVMASLRFAIRAFASQGHTPAAVLTKLTSLLDVSVDDHFATVLCAVVDVQTRICTFANAGHPNPLVANADSACFLDTKVGLPIGVRRGADYETATATIPPGATLMMFTDGLFERRREPVDISLERLRESATRASGSVTDLLAQVVDAQIPNGADDDTAILGVRWQN